MHGTERLSQYIDNELSPAERTACEAHLNDCAECRDALDDLRDLKRLAAADRDVVPPRDFWPGILERIQSSAGPKAVPFGTGTSGSRPGAGEPRRISFSLPELALAASLLIAVSSAVAYLATNRGVPARPAAVDVAEVIPIQAVAEPTIPPSPDVMPANFADAQFDRAVADLEQILVEQRDELDPGTVMVIARNLAAIDAAIREARTALEADPANPYLNTHLAEARRRKLDLLRHAATLNSAGD